jgi:hypothetical protein
MTPADLPRPENQAKQFAKSGKLLPPACHARVLVFSTRQGNTKLLIFFRRSQTQNFDVLFQTRLATNTHRLCSAGPEKVQRLKANE